ncbi:Hsp70 family protein [Micromonosporaceae bacterium B7E4]
MTPLGIDLGTTRSAVALVDSGGRPMILPNPLGEETTPSVVCFESRRSVLVGAATQVAGQSTPDRMVALVKRDLDGNRSPAERVKRALSGFPVHRVPIRREYVHALRRRGEPGDLDLVVQIRRDEVEVRRRRPVGPHRLGVAVADHAAALLDRARPAEREARLAAVLARRYPDLERGTSAKTCLTAGSPAVGSVCHYACGPGRGRLVRAGSSG